MSNPCDLPILDRTFGQVSACAEASWKTLAHTIANTPGQVTIGQWLGLAGGVFVFFFVIIPTVGLFAGWVASTAMRKP
jgi:hypothetical protein